MKPFRGIVLCCALAGVAAVAEPAEAAWNNVFQVTCLFRHHQTTTNYCPAPAVACSSPVVAAPVCASCASPAPCCQPQTSCSTSYVQRCYYQPVTTYQTQSYYEPVTTYRTSYYYEPVTSYSYSCYYDPCTCNYQQVAVPSTCYQLKSQCCPVQSWVQRCCQVPVTSYQKSCYWEPQTTCCSTPAPTPCCTPAPTPCCTPTSTPTYAANVEAAPAVVAPTVTTPPPASNQPPGVTEQRSTPPPPTINEQRSGNPMYERYYGPTQNPTTPSNGYRHPPLSTPAPVNPSGRYSPPPPVKLDRIVFATDARVEGQVVRSDNAPRANVRLSFVSTQRQASQQVVTANAAGRFQVALSSGGWDVYIHNQDGARVYHSRIDINDQRTPYITLVSR